MTDANRIRAILRKAGITPRPDATYELIRHPWPRWSVMESFGDHGEFRVISSRGVLEDYTDTPLDRIEREALDHVHQIALGVEFALNASTPSLGPEWN